MFARICVKDRVGGECVKQNDDLFYQGVAAPCTELAGHHAARNVFCGVTL